MNVVHFFYLRIYNLTLAKCLKQWEYLFQLQATEDRYQNKGAYIVLEPPNFDTPSFHSFDAVTPRPKVIYSTLKINVYSC